MSLLSVTLALALLALWAGIPVDGLGARDGSGAMMSVAQAATDGRIEIHLERVTYDPLYGDPGLTDRLSLGSYSGDGLGYYVVQFGGPILSACKSNLGQAGAAVLDYVPQSNLVERNYAQPSWVSNTGSGELTFELLELRPGFAPSGRIEGGGPDPFGYTYAVPMRTATSPGDRSTSGWMQPTGQRSRYPMTARRMCRCPLRSRSMGANRTACA